MSLLWAYPSVYTLGHRVITGILDDDVLVQEKVDGSQISFGILPNPDTGNHELCIRSKNAEILPAQPPAQFVRGVTAILERVEYLTPGYVYRGECLDRPKHNALAYDRVPRDHIVLFDIETSPQTFLSADELDREARRLNFEAVPVLFQGRVPDIALFRDLLQTRSFLGGQLVEGVVVKNYARFTFQKKVMIGKYVSEKFKEVQQSAWRQANPTSRDIIQVLINMYKTPARWQKAVLHLRDAGQLDDSPRDIGPLIAEIRRDIRTECEDDIKDALFRWAWPHLERGVTAGLPEWYKNLLLEREFDSGPGGQSGGGSENASGTV